jgi:hypothetical protein
MAVNGAASDLLDFNDNWAERADWQLFTEHFLDDGLYQQGAQREIKIEIKQEGEQVAEPQVKQKRHKVAAGASLEVQIEELKNEIASLIKKQESTANTADPSEKRQKANAISATLSRRRKTLAVLEKDQLIETLQEQNAALLNENYTLKAALEKSSNYFEQPPEFSITIPETTMLIKYKSPTSSPRKPVVDERNADPSRARRKL